ncbi:putative cysteine desulfurase iscS 2 [Nitrospina gracilis 3/211]|uniref:Putative cysteine desulfurase iscS 2 n=1 Tax=Nitrospina gracilis (strain 3/211) TaxID=1266370 RepID=M1Z1A5_NITG3|nr:MULTISPECIES: cysteine desulfurase family protein [Nitrospina]MCF8724138.1 cysteine desulfurase [Nitrospina sp. Nb-3]CCQ91284.1 putative cysteine desulfurase iscS 2 [Nitrospina gracilis 3/211]
MIYLDNAATTPMDPEVIEVMTKSMQEDFGNSGAVYRLGHDAKQKIQEAEDCIRDSLCIPARFRIVFTSGGSESNNLFIKGTCFPDKKVAYLGLEHPSVKETLDALKEYDNEPVSLLEYQKDGRLDTASIPELKKRKVRWLYLSHVNNELGSINDPRVIAPLLKEHAPQTRLFLDGVQAVGKMPITETMWEGLSGYSVSAHKFHGPKGIGLLVVDSRLSLKPQIHGGKQQHGMRSGTLPVPFIVGLGCAVKLAAHRASFANKTFSILRERLVTGLKALASSNSNLNLKFNSSVDPDNSFQSPAIVNFSFAPVEGEVVLHHLEKLGIYVGLGSACSAHSKEPSKILMGIGCTREEARCSLRISFNHNNTVEDVDCFLAAFAQAHETLYPSFSRRFANS